MRVAAAHRVGPAEELERRGHLRERAVAERTAVAETVIDHHDEALLPEGFELRAQRAGARVKGAAGARRWLGQQHVAPIATDFGDPATDDTRPARGERQRPHALAREGALYHGQ